METGKNFLLEIIKASVIGTITLFLTLWVNGSNELEYRDGFRAPYFNFPSAIEKDLEIHHKKSPIENISVVEYAIYNRTFSDLEEVKIYVKLLDAKKYRLISKKLTPPKRFPDLDITYLDTKKDGIYGFEVGVLKKTSNEYYNVNLIFEGDEAPKTEISIGNKNIGIVKYKKWKDNAIAILIVIAIYAVLLVPFGFWAYYSGKRAKNRFTKKLEGALQVDDSPLNKEQVSFAIDKYKEVKDHKKDGWFKKRWKEFTSTE